MIHPGLTDLSQADMEAVEARIAVLLATEVEDLDQAKHMVEREHQERRAP